MSEIILCLGKVTAYMKDHALHSYPEECCGFLLGEWRQNTINVVKAISFENERKENRQRRFLISPEEYMHAEEIASDQKLTLLGVYHSHPDHLAQPSEYDFKSAITNFLYPIISVNKDQINDIRWWCLQDDRSSYEELSLYKY